MWFVKDIAPYLEWFTSFLSLQKKMLLLSAICFIARTRESYFAVISHSCTDATSRNFFHSVARYLNSLNFALFTFKILAWSVMATKLYLHNIWNQWYINYICIICRTWMRLKKEIFSLWNSHSFLFGCFWIPK